MKNKIRYFSTFTGIGGFEIGIQKAYEELQKLCIENERQGVQGAGDSQGQPSKFCDNSSVGFTCIGYSEINKYADQIYQSKFPTHHNYGDITIIKEKELPDFDLFVGGFPCQAFSIAGKRGGFDDTRGTLFFDVARILKEKQPRNFILENVKGLLSHDNGRTFKTIINTLIELGYCVEWQVLNAKNFGVPQNRERVFIVGHLGGIPRRKVFPITGNSGQVAKKIKVEGTLETDGWEKRNESTRRVHNIEGISPTIPTAQGGGVMNKIAIAYHNNRNIATTSENCNSLTSSFRGHPDGDGRPAILEGTRIRRLTPLECERLMSYPDGWTEGLSDTQRYKTLGNGIVSNVVAEVVKRLYY